MKRYREGKGKIPLGLADGTAASGWANATQGAKAIYFIF